MTSTTDLPGMLPWSHPFLLVDRLLDCVPHVSARTCKQVTVSDAVGEGADTAEACFPSVLILEGLSQSAALLFRLSYGPDALSGAPLLGYLKAKFRGDARPGDTLTYTVTAIKMTSRSGVFKGVARVDDKVVAATELAFGIGAP
jgi:3-hydroxyacyl-[acyl-carrier-protein] dehydratase